MADQELHTREILLAVESGGAQSQRSLARRLGIALGLTNLIVHRLARKGWIRIVRIKPNRVRYLITPSGLAEKTRITRKSLEGTIRFYSEARERIGQRFAELSAEWPPPDTRTSMGERGEKRIVFCGAGEVAEIGYVCLQETDFRLVGVTADGCVKPFFGMPVYSLDHLSATELCGIPYDRVVVMVFTGRDGLAHRLDERGLTAERLFWI